MVTRRKRRAKALAKAFRNILAADEEAFTAESQARAMLVLTTNYMPEITRDEHNGKARWTHTPLTWLSEEAESYISGAAEKVAVYPESLPVYTNEDYMSDIKPPADAPAWAIDTDLYERKRMSWVLKANEDEEGGEEEA